VAAYTPQRLIHGRSKPPSSIASHSDTGASSLLSQASTDHNETGRSIWSRATSYFTSSPNASAPSTEVSSRQPPEDLWTPEAIASSTFPVGSVITNHFEVLSKTNEAILVRCGDSPLTNPDSPRDSDGLFELRAVPKFDRGYVEFTLKSIFYNGTEANKAATSGMSSWMWWLHAQYAKLWMETGVGQCRLSSWHSVPAQWRVWEEEKERRKLEAAAAQKEASKSS
jgi:hypothetical protein